MPTDDIAAQLDDLMELYKADPVAYYGTSLRAGGYTGEGVNAARRLVVSLHRAGPGDDHAKWHATVTYAARLPLG